MKPAKFEYQRAEDAGEAVALLRQSDGDGKLIAGGQSLVPMMNLRLAQPGLLIDIRRIESLSSVERRGDDVYVGAGVTHAVVEDGAVPDLYKGMMTSVARQIAYRAVRNRGTVGGSVAHADPAGDWPTALAVLGARAHLRGPVVAREVALADLFIGPFTTALELDEIIEGFTIPALAPSASWGYYKVCRKPGEFADSIGAVVTDPDRGVHRVYLGAAGGAPISVTEACDRLSAGVREISVADARDIITGLGGGFDGFETQIHAVALSRAVSRAFS